MDRILDDLNDAQRAAVQHGRGPLMVLAGAGSGKTRVITRRVARLLRDGVPADHIVALTFTNKAAKEMADRVQELGGARVQVCTFHSMCARILRFEGWRLGYPRDFTIYDTYDRDTLLKALIEELDLAHFEVKPAAVGRRISQLKNVKMRADELILGLGDVDRVVEQVYLPYEERMKRHAALDFDDLLLRVLDLFKEHPEVGESYRDRIEYLLVDEFQDTNRVQYEISTALSGRHRNLCVVGDPDQSIYRFRGADIRNILDFQNDFPDATSIVLEQNYRSTACILRAAQAVIEHNSDRLEKSLVATGEEGQPIEVVECSDATSEAREVGSRIEQLRRHGVPLDQIAIFYRAHFLSRGLEEVLRRGAIPYEVVGGLSFFERREIKDLIAYLRVVVNPLDDVATDRILNVPPRGLGKVSVGRLRAAAEQAGMSLAEALGDESCWKGLPAKARAAVAELGKLFEDLRTVARQGAAQALAMVMERTKYVEHACRLGDPEDVAREENIQELYSDTVTFDKEQQGSLADYLAQVSLQTSQDRNADTTGPRVSMMTVHAAKGLEFDHVFVVGLEENLFPHGRSAGSDQDLEEERRLMYVAITRARKRLTLCSADYRMIGGEMQSRERSRFLHEVPDDCTAVAGSWRRGLDPDLDHGVFEHGDESDPLAATEIDQSSGAEGLTAGMYVAHRFYGTGEVLKVSGHGIQARATVRFDGGEVRELLLEYAGLQLVPRSLGS